MTIIKRLFATALFAATLSVTGCAISDDGADDTAEETTTMQESNVWRPVCWDVTAFYSIWWEHIDNFHRGTTVFEYYKVQISGVYWSHIITHGGRVGWVRTAALC